MITDWNALCADSMNKRTDAAKELLASNPSRLELRLTIENVPEYRLDAWQRLRTMRPTKFELLHIAAHVQDLREPAWQEFLALQPSLNELHSVACNEDCLRLRAWQAMLQESPSLEVLTCLSMPNDPTLVARATKQFLDLSPSQDKFDEAMQYTPMATMLFERRFPDGFTIANALGCLDLHPSLAIQALSVIPDSYLTDEHLVSLLRRSFDADFRYAIFERLKALKLSESVCVKILETNALKHYGDFNTLPEEMIDYAADRLLEGPFSNRSLMAVIFNSSSRSIAAAHHLCFSYLPVDTEMWCRGELIFVDANSTENIREKECGFGGYGCNYHVLKGEFFQFGYSTNSLFDVNAWSDGIPRSQFEHFPDGEEVRFTFERALNECWMNPLFRQVQVVKVIEEAALQVEVEDRSGRVRGGMLIWQNCD